MKSDRHKIYFSIKQLAPLGSVLAFGFLLTACATAHHDKISDRITSPSLSGSTPITAAKPQVTPTALAQQTQPTQKTQRLPADHPFQKIEDALVENPTDVVTLTDRGAYYAKFNYNDQALKDYTQALEIAPDYVRARLLRIEIYKKKGLKNLALTDYALAMKEQPRNANLYQSRGVYYGALEEYRLAEKDLKKALSLNPESAQYNHNMSVLLSKQNKLKKALVHANKATVLQPNYGIAQHGRGIILARMGKFDTANSAFEAAIATNPNWAMPYLSRGMSYEKLGMRHHAVKDYEMALTIKPDFLPAKRHLKRLRSTTNKTQQNTTPLRLSNGLAIQNNL